MSKPYLMRAMAVFGLLAVLMACPAFGEKQDGMGGIKLGALTIFPSLVTEARYNSNIYFVPEEEVDRLRLGTNEMESDFIINVSPDILFDVSVTSFNFQFGYNFYGDIYTGFDDEESKHDELNASNHQFRTKLSYDSPVGFFIGLKDAFLVQEAFTESDEYVDYLMGDQLHNDGTVTIGYKRPPEENVYFGVSYRNIWDKYQEEDFDIFDRMGHLGMVDLKLKFFPRTAIVVDLEGGTYRNPEEPDYNVLLYQGVAGLVGQITNHLQLTAKGGFGVWDYAINEDYRNFLASGEIAFVWPPDVKVAAGYDHRIVDATDTNFRVTDEFYLKYGHRFLNRFKLDLLGSYMLNSYSRPYEREETFLQGKLDFTTRILYWFYIGVGYNLERKVIDPGEQTESYIMRHIGLLKLIAGF